MEQSKMPRYAEMRLMGAALSVAIHAMIGEHGSGIDGYTADGGRYVEAEAEHKALIGVEVWVVAPDGTVYAATYDQLGEDQT